MLMLASSFSKHLDAQHKLLVVGRSMVSQKNVYHFIKWILGSKFYGIHRFYKLFILLNVLIWGHQTLRSVAFQHWVQEKIYICTWPWFIFIQSLRILFHQSQLDVQRRKYDSVSINQWCIQNIMLTNLKRASFRPILFLPVLISYMTIL